MRIFLIGCFFLISPAFAQTLKDDLGKAMSNLEKDEQFSHAIISMYVVDAKTGIPLFEKNAAYGLAPASCQKVLTSISAFSILGHDYKFKTELGYDGAIEKGTLNGNIYIIGYGDPSLGSWRWKTTAEDVVMGQFMAAISKKGIKHINGNLFGYDRKWESNTTPDGWIWQDIGNYYGAGASALNWRENQYDLVLEAGDKIGAPARIKKTNPVLESTGLYCEVKTAAKGSGDNAYIYLPPYSNAGYVRGTIPLGENNFMIAGALPDPGGQLVYRFAELMKDSVQGVLFAGSFNGIEVDKKDLPIKPVVFFTRQSPPLDSLNYWFLKRSVNLYGESFLKAIAYEKKGFGSTDSGVTLIKNFWKDKGIDPSAINIMDGSGLSPANRVTTSALVTAMQYARDKPWFASFYNALPEMNGIRMKDGYINGVRSYTGYIKSKSGKEYTFSFIANNFSGNPGTVREKIWKLLDILK